jgi:hypothetical protein
MKNKLKMRKLWSAKNKGVNKSKRKILKRLEISNQTTKHSLNIVPLPLVLKDDL